MTENKPAAPPPEEGPGWRRHYTRTRAVLAAVTATILTVFALLEGAFNLFPGLRGEEACASERDATISKPRLEATVSRGEALDLQRASKAGLSPERLAEPGKLVSFDVVSAGLRDSPIQVRTRVRVAGGGLVPDPELRDLLVAEVRPRECNDRDHLRVWTEIPAGEGRYVIEIELLDDEGSSLHADSTDEFDA